MATSTPRGVHPRPSLRNLSLSKPSTPPSMTRLGHSEQLEVGDTVTVPGGMDGTVKFVGEVKGKPGIFVGVELSKRWASRGKNNGDAEGYAHRIDMKASLFTRGADSFCQGAILYDLNTRRWYIPTYQSGF